MQNSRLSATGSVSLHNLYEAAKVAAGSSYSPYSKFRVGAAVSAGGKIYTGTNIENASYGLTICAERVAIFSAITDGQRTIDALAVACIDVAPTEPINLMVPCGACRQVIQEFAGPKTKITVDGEKHFRVDELLPIPFKFP